MGFEKFCPYLNELENLTQEIRQAPEFSMHASGLTRDELLARFEMSRTLINLLHFATIHLMRANADDYDTESETWIRTSINRAADDVRGRARLEKAATVKKLADRSLSLISRLMDDLQSAAA
tara:strand:+ start:412 stop:777 length:366 start_codon:yes stop_codon:yes gene_type:complete